MKKTIILIVLIVLSYSFLGEKVESSTNIPEDAIRIRILANSNDKEDQDIKMQVKDEVQKELYNILSNTKTIDEARNTLINNLDNIDLTVKNVLIKEKYDLGYKINFGYNYFPKKEFKGINYDEGMYESLLITLGKGEGDNWWCVLFPPLCLLEATESTDVEYKSFVKEMLDKYL